MMTLGEALRRIPPTFYLRCGVEVDEEGDGHFLAAVIMEEAPEGGWDSPDAYFGGTGYVGGEERIRAWKFDDVARVGISARLDDPELFNRLLVEMIVRKWPVPNSRQSEQR